MRIFISLSAAANFTVTKLKGKEVIAFPKSKKTVVDQIQKLLAHAFAARSVVLGLGVNATQPQHDRIRKQRDEGPDFIKQANALAKEHGMSSLKMPIKGAELYNYKPDPKDREGKFGVRGKDDWLDVVFLDDTEFAALVGGTPAKDASPAKASKPAAPKIRHWPNAIFTDGTKADVYKSGALGQTKAAAKIAKKYPNSAVANAMASISRITKYNVPQQMFQASKDMLYVMFDGGYISFAKEHSYYAVDMHSGPNTKSSGPVNERQAITALLSYMDKVMS